MKRYSRAILILLSLLSILSCMGEQTDFLSHRDFALDTTVSIKLYGIQNRKPLEDGMEEIRRLEELLSAHLEGSDIYQLSARAGSEWVDISSESQDLLQRGIAFGELSEGLLDITAGPLIDLWAIDPPHGHVPTEEELNQTLPLIDYRLIELDNQRAFLPNQGMEVNLGAIAKGYIADRLKEFYSDQGISNGIINLGGNILLMGSKPGDQPFRIGIQDPQSDRGADLGAVTLTDSSLVSSGDYERFFEDSQGKRYHHIFNPYTGYPGDTGLQQVTVISSESLLGDALSTSLFLMGLNQAMELVESLEEVEAVFVTKSNQIHISSGLADSFEFRGASNGYTMAQ